VRVVLADDAVVIREGLARMLTGAAIDVAAQVGTAEDLMAAVDRLRPEVAVVDIRMPPSWTDEGLIAAGRIRQQHPDVGVLILSQYIEPTYALRLLERAPVRTGYLLKDRMLDLTDFSGALKRIAAGETVVDPALVAQLIDRPRENDPLAQLTEREREVLALMAEGLTDRGISERLYVTPKTTETHIRHIFAKLGVPADPTHNRRVHAVLTYLRS
jgi:DNA-binding NarL/FixJ family response regulator